MKKFGFTMAELLVTLSIIGVVAVITAPLVENIIPDKNKAMALKVYKTLSEINAEILSDPSLYMRTGTCVGLDCTQAPSDPSIPSYTSTSDKYPVILKTKLDVDKSAAGSNTVFTTTDGIWWQVGKFSDGSGYAVLVDVEVNTASLNNQLLNDNKGLNCFYSANPASCKKHPDRFRFAVDNEGRVTGSDMLTRAYLENPTKLTDKKKDFDRAKVLFGGN